MGNVNVDGIWTPDEEEALDPDVYLATMAESISEGIGKRLKKQETRVSLRATSPERFNVINEAGGTNWMKDIPLTVGGVTNAYAPDPDYAGGNHATGVEMEGGYAKILTDGLYTVTGQVSLVAADGYPAHSFDFLARSNNGVIGLPAYGITNLESYVGGTVSDTRYFVAGDTIWLSVGPGTDHVGGIRVMDAMLQIAMHYAT